MNLPGIRSALKAIEEDLSIYEEKNFEQRTEAIDFLDFHAIYLQSSKLKDRTKKLKARLIEIDYQLFEKLRAGICNGKYKGNEFRKLVSEYVKININSKPGYDNLDIFINQLIYSQPAPEQTEDLQPEMVFYQKTPARIIFELAEKIHFTKDDVFFDIGSGLGQAGILVNLLTGIRVISIEFEPAFCNYARACAAELNLPGVTFVNTDARDADYSDGTIFFLYTPFMGDMQKEVLARLGNEALRKKIKVITYGPCTPEVAAQSWLESVGPKDTGIYKLAVFQSL